eukprot:SAG31_NODE_11968_length_981_cov_0.993197_1_plen_101_part_10
MNLPSDIDTDGVMLRNMALHSVVRDMITRRAKFFPQVRVSRPHFQVRFYDETWSQISAPVCVHCHSMECYPEIVSKLTDIQSACLPVGLLNSGCNSHKTCN